MTKTRKVDAMGCSIDFNLVLSLIDAALVDGAQFCDLRWRTSRAQRTALVGYQFFVSNGSNEVNRTLESGAWADSPRFYGIPIRVDDNIPSNSMVLERIVQTEPHVTIVNMLVPHHYE